MKKVESYLKSLEELESKDRTNIKYYVAAAVISFAAKQVSPDVRTIANLKEDDITEDVLLDSYRLVNERYNDLGATDQVAKGSELLQNLKSSLATQLQATTAV